MSQTQVDKALWLAYANGILSAIGGPPGPKNAIFFSNKAQMGPMAANGIPQPYINYGIYEIGDNLLSADNLFYYPSNTKSYIASLRTYLSWVDLEGSENPGVLAKLIQAQSDLTAAHKKYMEAVQRARADHDILQKAGMTTLPFGQWWPQNAPALRAAFDAKMTAAAAVMSIQSALKGPYAKPYAKYNMAISTALTRDGQPAPGIKMLATGDTPPSLHDILNNNVSEPEDTYFVPAYNAPEYSEVVRGWLLSPANDGVGKTTFDITISAGQDVDETTFGHTSAGAGLGFSYPPWISFGIDGSSDHQETLHGTKLDNKDVHITVHYDEIQRVDIHPGEWDIKDPKGTFPKLKRNAPGFLKTRVKVSQLVLIKNMSYTIKFYHGVRKSFDKRVKESIEGSGYLNIFGVTVAVGDDEHESDTHTHTGSWDSATSVFTVKPTPQGAFASIAAVIGDKIEI